jgi:hypothetical protein
MILETSTWSRKPCNPLDNPFGTRLSPMSWVRPVTHVSGLDRRQMAEPEGFEPSIGLYNPITV